MKILKPLPRQGVAMTSALALIALVAVVVLGLGVADILPPAVGLGVAGVLAITGAITYLTGYSRRTGQR